MIHAERRLLTYRVDWELAIFPTTSSSYWPGATRGIRNRKCAFGHVFSPLFLRESAISSMAGVQLLAHIGLLLPSDCAA